MAGSRHQWREHLIVRQLEMKGALRGRRSASSDRVTGIIFDQPQTTGDGDARVLKKGADHLAGRRELMDEARLGSTV